MKNAFGGGLALLLAPGLVIAGELTVSLDDGTLLATLPVPEGTSWCVLWNHSVQGFLVEDCYENRSGKMILVRSHQPDFAAGLGHLPGRGIQTSDGAGGYWIEEIDEPVPGNSYVMRPGGMKVDHRLSTEDVEVSLTALAAGRRVHIALREAMQ